VHDNRQPQRPLTYLAESGVLVQSQEGARLIMQNGNIEQGEGRGARLSVLGFERYVFDLDQYAGPQRASDRDTSERYLAELFDAQSRPLCPRCAVASISPKPITGYRRHSIASPLRSSRWPPPPRGAWRGRAMRCAFRERL